MMSAWARRMHRRAVTLGTVVTSCGHSSVPYPTRMEKVKFGVPLNQVCKHDIPGPLLILILKLNKEAPYKKDVFRAPGHQGNMKKLIHFLQHGHLVNIDNFSIYTIASVLKKFLRKLPGGIFGPENEEELFHIIKIENNEEKREQIHRLLISLPLIAQRVLVLLFGTFQSIAELADRCQTGMTSEALGVSVAPSFFQLCVSGRSKVARPEDVNRFKAQISVASSIMTYLIDNFGGKNLFGLENYKYYARITGRIFKVEADWIFTYNRLPPELVSSRKASLEADKGWHHHLEGHHWGLSRNLEAISSQEECQSTPALIHATEPLIRIEHAPSSGSFTDAYTRLSVSLEENGLYKDDHHLNLDELKVVNRYAESTKSLTYLPQVHERQAARMKTRSEWFLNPSPCPSPTPLPAHVEEPPYPPQQQQQQQQEKVHKNKESMKRSSTSSATAGGTLGGSEGKLIRRTSSKEKRLIRRSSSKKQDKENGGKKKSMDEKTSSSSLSYLCSPKKNCSVVHRASSSHGIIENSAMSYNNNNPRF